MPFHRRSWVPLGLQRNHRVVMRLARLQRVIDRRRCWSNMKLCCRPDNTPSLWPGPLFLLSPEPTRMHSTIVCTTTRAATYLCLRYAGSLPSATALCGAGTRNASRSIPAIKPVFPARKSPCAEALLDGGEWGGLLGESCAASGPRLGHSSCSLRHFVKRC